MQPMSSIVRGAFVAGSLLFLIIGLYLFAFAESVATLPAAARGENPWPWPIGPLLMRFVAAFAFVGAVSCALVARRPNAATVAAFSSLAIVFGALLLLHSIVSWGNIDWSKPAGIAWLSLLIVGLVASVVLELRARQRAGQSTPTFPMPASVRRITLFLLVLNGVVGTTMFFLPELGRQRWPWELSNTVNVQLLGAVFLGGALSMLWVWRRPSWYGYDTLFVAVGVYSTGALVASFMHWNLFADRPITAWIFIVLYVAGVAMGYYVFYRHNVGGATREARGVSVQVGA